MLKEAKKLPVRKIVLPNAKPHQVRFYPSPSAKRYYNSNSHLRISSGKKKEVQKKPQPSMIRNSNVSNGRGNRNRNSNQLVNPFSKTPPKSAIDNNNSPKRNPILVPRHVKPISASGNKKQKKEDIIDINDFMKVLSKKKNESNTITLSNFQIEDNSTEAITSETNLTSDAQNQINNSLSDIDSEEENETDENVLMIKEEQAQLSPKEKEELMALREKYKNKYNQYFEEVKKYLDDIEIDKIYEMYKEIEDKEENADIDSIANNIEEYIRKKIPNKAKVFIDLFHNLIFYENQYRNSDKEIEKA